MYSQVPPPEHSSSVASVAIVTSNEESSDCSKPTYVSDSHWKKFQELKARREKECGKAAEKRKVAMKNKALRTGVSQELTPADKALLEEEGVSLPSHRQRKRKQQSVEEHVSSDSGPSAKSEQRWEDVKQYLEPNPQLKGVEKGRYATKSNLEEKLDTAIEQGQFDKAVAMSEKLSQREFASKVATAFDCQDFVKRKKMEEEKRRAKKKKLKWRFEHKQRWEMKGNM